MGIMTGNDCIKINGIHPRPSLIRTGIILCVDLCVQSSSAFPTPYTRHPLPTWQSNKITTVVISTHRGKGNEKRLVHSLISRMRGVICSRARDGNLSFHRLWTFTQTPACQGTELVLPL